MDLGVSVFLWRELMGTQFKEEANVVTKRTYLISTLYDVVKELSVLIQKRHNGSVTVVLVEGGIRSMVSEERTKLDAAST